MKDTTKAGLLGFGVGATAFGLLGYTLGNYFPAIPPAPKPKYQTATRIGKVSSPEPEQRILSVIFLDKNFNYLWNNTTPKVTITEFKINNKVITEGNIGGYYQWDDVANALQYYDGITKSETFSITFTINGKTYTITGTIAYEAGKHVNTTLIFQTLEV